MIYKPESAEYTIDDVRIRIQCSWHWSSRSIVKIYLDDNLVKIYGPKFFFDVVTIETNPLIDGSGKNIRVDIWVGKSGFSFAHRLLIDGTLVAGPEQAEGFMLSMFPNRSIYWYYANHGVIPGLIFAFLMHVSQPPGRFGILFDFAFFSFLFSMSLYIFRRILTIIQK